MFALLRYTSRCISPITPALHSLFPQKFSGPSAISRRRVARVPAQSAKFSPLPNGSLAVLQSLRLPLAFANFTPLVLPSHFVTVAYIDFSPYFCLPIHFIMIDHWNSHTFFCPMVPPYHNKIYPLFIPIHLVVADIWHPSLLLHLYTFCICLSRE